MKKNIISSFILIMTCFLFVACSNNNNNNKNLISEDDAKKTAVEQMDGFTVDDISSCTLNEQDPNNKKYDAQFKLDYVIFTISIDAEDASVLKIASETETAGKSDNGVASKDLGIQSIEKIATEKINGSKESDIYYCCYVDGEDMESYYIVELGYNDKTYEFNIKASTGEILKEEIEDLSNLNEQN